MSEDEITELKSKIMLLESRVKYLKSESDYLKSQDRYLREKLQWAAITMPKMTNGLPSSPDDMNKILEFSKRWGKT